MDDVPHLITVGVAAERIGISSATVHRWARAGRLRPHATAGNNELLFTEETVERARAAREAEVAARATVA